MTAVCNKNVSSYFQIKVQFKPFKQDREFIRDDFKSVRAAKALRLKKSKGIEENIKDTKQKRNLAVGKGKKRQ